MKTHTNTEVIKDRFFVKSETMASKLPVRLPTFDKRIIDDLALLVKLTAENLKPIAEVAVQLIVSKAGDGEIAQLAASLQSRADKIRPIVHGLSTTFWECAKARVPKDIFVQAISQLNLSPDSNAVLHDTYSRHYTTIIDTTQAFSMSLPQYQHLDWRIDVEIGRRSIQQDSDLKFMVRLDTSDPSSKEANTKSVHMQSDLSSMKHILSQLEAALAEERSVHARRFQRYIQ